MNKNNSGLIYTERLRKYYLRYEITGLDEIHLLSHKMLLLVIIKTII